MGVGYVPAPPPPCFTPPAKTPERPAPSPLPFDIVGHYLGEMGLEDTPERRYETWDRIGRIIERKIKEREEAAKRASAPVADGPYTYVAQQTHTTPGAFVPHQVQTFAQTFTGGNRQQQLYRQDTFTAISEHHTSAASSAADYSPLVPTLG
ncbi:hypothetical protein FRB99_007169 [Tulasnella sp. 403]|nr:hypothetical protein FRB99_007169 [Tulasnella sp. 403]